MWWRRGIGVIWGSESGEAKARVKPLLLVVLFRGLKAPAPCGKNNGKINDKGVAGGHVLSHVSDDEAVASVGHPGFGGFVRGLKAPAPCVKNNGKINGKGVVGGHLLSHVSDDEAVASVGHPGFGGGADEEREDAGPSRCSG